jgi:D-arginine dehydrogenase
MDTEARTRWVIIGGGFAGAATAWALARLGAGPGFVLEQEDAVGVHASGRNAGLLKLGEDDPFILSLSLETARLLRVLRPSEPHLFLPSGGLTIASGARAAALADTHDLLQRHRVDARMLTPPQARDRHPLLRDVPLDAALWLASEGVIDVQALLSYYLGTARAEGIALRTRCTALGLLLDRGRVVGVSTNRGEIRADAVIDASGAWAGRLRGELPALPLVPMRRHLVVTAEWPGVSRSQPFVWFDGAGLYFRPEGGGLMMSPCDETPATPGLPPTDPAALELLAQRLARYAPSLADVTIRKSWACLRTFAPDRRPIIGFDPALRGLFHVSGLGGFGVMTSAGAGRLAADLLLGRPHGWTDASLASPARTAIRAAAES